MFFEENKVSNLLICPKCSNRLKNPHVLPCCGETVCAKCLPSKANADENCPFCTKPIDQNNNYQPNKALERLISLDPTDVYRGELFQELNAKTDLIRTELNDLKQINETFAMKKITDHCQQLREKVLAKTVKTLESAKKTSDSIMHKIDSYEKSCTESYQTGKKSFEEELNGLEKEFAEYETTMNKLLSRAHDGSGEYSMLSEVHRLKIKFKIAKLNLQKLIFTREMLEYHDCPQAILGCILVYTKLNPTYSDLSPLRIKEDLLNAPDLLFTYFQVGFLKNGHIVFSVSDGEIFK